MFLDSGRKPEYMEKHARPPHTGRTCKLHTSVSNLWPSCCKARTLTARPPCGLCWFYFHREKSRSSVIWTTATPCDRSLLSTRASTATVHSKVWPSGPALFFTHLSLTQRTHVCPDWSWSQICRAAAADSCTGHYPPPAAAAAWGCRRCLWGQAPWTAGPCRAEAKWRTKMKCCRADAVSGTTSPQEPGPAAVSDWPPPLPGPRGSQADRGEQPIPRHMSPPAPCPVTRERLQRGKEIETE